MSVKNISDILHEFTDEDLQKLHKVLLEMYADIQRVCHKYGIKPILGGGSALGAVRHKGFIPWDDDLDVVMSREDYKKFKKAFDKELSENYYLYAPNTPTGGRTCFPRIVKKNTTLMDIRGYNAEYYNGIWIDINLIENVPENKLLRKITALRADAIRVVAASVHWYEQRSKYSDQYYAGSISYKCKLLIGRMMSFRSYKKWYDIYDRYVGRFRKSTMVTIPSGRNYYMKEMHKREVFFPPRKVKFENLEVYIPNDYDKYLRALYGDNYMELPPEEKRERHKVMYFDAERGRTM